ncbi:hypothetical protein [Phenylobacterium soli]|uniref:Uncharacterized protein n=1 Tax=Phenylobacterium soli TaxID=2170551 RepID=A0A328AL09_9CAUL|nr:hypothetical protein [Phenylobacterium soli]RAK53548.1 hypothetical protein DJ017_02900 [Phenylobacterium soli]
MLKERRMVAEQIAGALFEAEAAIDAAISKTAQLTGVMPALRKQAGASALVGQDAVERASQAIMALAEARRAIVETHKELSVAQVQVGLGAVAIDGGGTKPATSALGGRALRTVSSAA